MQVYGSKVYLDIYFITIDAHLDTLFDIRLSSHVSKTLLYPFKVLATDLLSLSVHKISKNVFNGL